MKSCAAFLLLLQAATLGDRKVLLEDGQYGLKYFPDGCLAMLQTAPKYRVLMAVGISSYLLEGKSMDSLRPVRKVLTPGAAGEFDNGYAGIYGVWRQTKSGEVLAIYHAEDQEQMPKLFNGVNGFYGSVGAAVSQDDGNFFTKVGPIITSQFAKDPHGRGDQGCGEPAILPDKSNRYLYCYYTDHSHSGGREVQIAMARSPVASRGRPGTWKKFFEGSFDQPGLGGKETPVVSAEQGSGALFPSVTYCKKLSKYIMVLNFNYYREFKSGAPVKSGIYVALSEDGIRWATPVQLTTGYSVAQIDREVAWHPTLVLDDHKLSGWLYYSYSPRWGHNDPRKRHFLVGQPIDLKWLR